MLWYGILLLLTGLLCGIDSQAPVFQVHPVSINTTEGSVVEFTCAANNTPTLLAFLVDGFGGGVDSNKGFDEQPPMGTDTVNRTLLVTASVADNDNSMIKCQAVNAGLMGANSDTAILRVQGPLSSVINSSYSFVTCYSVNISWSPPFTLPGTDITGYNISATNNGTTTNYFTSNSYYELSLIEPFDGTMVNISGYNGLDGVVATLGTIMPPAQHVNFSLNIIIDDTLNISLNFIVEATTSICPYEYPTSLEYRLFHDDHLISSNRTSFADVVDIASPLNITNNEVYTVLLSFTNELAPELYQYNNISTTFDTYDLVSVRVLNSSDSRVCLECSFSSFSTDNAGCTIELVSSTNSTLTYTQSFSKPNPDSDNVEGCIYVISPGQYNITVYGGDRPPVLIPELTITGTIIEDMITSTAPAASITVNTSPTPSMDIMATDSSGISSTTTIFIIIAVIVLVLIVIVIFVIVVLVYRKKNKKKENVELKTISKSLNETPPGPPIEQFDSLEDKKQETTSASDNYVIIETEQPPPHFTVESST